MSGERIKPYDLTRIMYMWTSSLFIRKLEEENENEMKIIVTMISSDRISGLLLITWTCIQLSSEMKDKKKERKKLSDMST